MPLPKRVIISGGGTGGHIFPAIAIANGLKRVNEEIDILFVGAKGRMEMQRVPEAGYKIEGLWISGIQRKLTWGNLMFPFKLIHSLVAARNILKRFEPQLAIGVGGYASGPMLQVANWSGVPTLIQEQNSFPGITNKILAKKVNKICVAYEGMDKYFPLESIVHTGNPVRANMLNISASREEALAHFDLKDDKKVVFITGGSLGAQAINESIGTHLKDFADAGLQLIWQCGGRYEKWALEAVKGFEQQVKVMPFVKRMDLAYMAADLIVSRAGALSISEQQVIGKPTILMPSPNVSEDHQTHNAMALVKRKAAVMVKDVDAKEKLKDAILSIIRDDAQCAELSNNIKKMAKADATERIVQEALQLIKN